jgi:hypothetical protein
MEDNLIGDSLNLESEIKPDRQALENNEADEMEIAVNPLNETTKSRSKSFYESVVESMTPSRKTITFDDLINN